MKKNNYLPFVWFVLGYGIFMSTRMSKLVPSIHIAILIAPIFILRFIRTQPAKKGIWLTLLGFLLSMNIALWGLFEFDNASLMTFFSLIRSSLLAVLWFLPFMTDRLIYPKFKGKGIWTTLIFPIITTAIFFLSSLEGPFDDGSGTSSAFSYGSLTFIQAKSLFGIWTFVFIYSWLFSTINYFWENHFHWKKIKMLAIIYPSVLLLVFLFGVIKTSSLTSPKSDTVKIAAVVLIPEDGKAVRMERIFNKKATSPFEKTISRIESLTKKAAENGAKIVSFQEFTMTINEKDENRLVEQYKRIAQKNNIYLSITYAYFAKEGKGENKHMFIDNNGEIQLDYAKRYLLGFGPFGETAVFRKGAEIIQSTDTPYGKIGISICRDMGFPSFMRQAARDNVDIMLSPSYDWPKSPAPWYLSNTIENGFSFVRPTYNGYTYAADYHGNVLAHMDSDETEDGIMYADVPTKGIKTLYPMVGDLLGWLCVLGMVTLVVLSIKGRAHKKHNSLL
ncbi:MAG: carbon-nitrogen hydrolase family protein [Calditrichia bacterium]|nr:carbon-nitrogen hydrolase family protein [Calditrichia bacterium]